MAIPSDDSTGKLDSRPGYFGYKRDERVAELNSLHGECGWRLEWVIYNLSKTKRLFYVFEDACAVLYERSYYDWFSKRPEDLNYVCSFGECIDNSMTNMDSGIDYLHQEAKSTHIQDIALRNVLRTLGRKFEGPTNKILTIRGKDSNGFRFNPGQVPFFVPELITQPSLRQKWALPGSVEDFWQSNKWIRILDKEK